MGRLCSIHRGMRNAFKDLDRKPERKSTWETFVQWGGYYYDRF
jgi:hypothetical protein